MTKVVFVACALAFAFACQGSEEGSPSGGAGKGGSAGKGGTGGAVSGSSGTGGAGARGGSAGKGGGGNAGSSGRAGSAGANDGMAGDAGEGGGANAGETSGGQAGRAGNSGQAGNVSAGAPSGGAGGQAAGEAGMAGTSGTPNTGGVSGEESGGEAGLGPSGGFGGAHDEPFACELDARVGLWFVTFETVSGNCGEQASGLVRIDDPLAVSEGCELDAADSISDDECRLSRSFTCESSLVACSPPPPPDNGEEPATDTISYVSYTDQTGQDAVSGLFTMIARCWDGTDVCVGTYGVEYERQ
jgi:hypothetical protein